VQGRLQFGLVQERHDFGANYWTGRSQVSDNTSDSTFKAFVSSIKTHTKRASFLPPTQWTSPAQYQSRTGATMHASPVKLDSATLECQPVDMCSYLRTRGGSAGHMPKCQIQWQQQVLPGNLPLTCVQNNHNNNASGPPPNPVTPYDHLPLASRPVRTAGSTLPDTHTNWCLQALFSHGVTLGTEVNLQLLCTHTMSNKHGDRAFET
jgi:hypothetical protein